MRNGLKESNRSVLFDFFTGQSLEATQTNSLGKVYHTRTIPAYTLPGQAAMGPKGSAGANRNMLIQPGASYAYMEIAGGQPYSLFDPFNPSATRMLSAGVQTWQPTWNNYREPDASGIYQDVAGQVPVWRQAATYGWQSPAVYPDGSIQNFVPFTWNATLDARWVKASETVRYDHYSHALEARDANGSYAAQKTGYGQTQLVASATNARYTELAYSGAEDQIAVNGTIHFGSEIVAGGTADKTVAHTGFYSNSLDASQTGFRYQAQAGRDVDMNKPYRVSAWVHKNAPRGKIYASLNGNRLAEASRTSATTKKAGDWYLLNLLVTLPDNANGQLVEFGCVNEGSAPGNFDDFRVAPLTAVVTSKVYDPRTNKLLYGLDNDNLFTHYEYNSTGRLRRVYQEALDGTGGGATAEKLVKEYEFNYAQLLFPTWVTSIYKCETDADNNNTGNELRQVVDINPLNNPPTSPKWEVNGPSANCAVTVCVDETGDGIPRRLRNNVCEQAQQTTVDCIATYCNGRPGTYNVYHWIWPDGTPAYDTYGDCHEGGCQLARPQVKQRASRKVTASVYSNYSTLFPLAK
jgi:hypothetical protein